MAEPIVFCEQFPIADIFSSPGDFDQYTAFPSPCQEQLSSTNHEVILPFPNFLYICSCLNIRANNFSFIFNFPSHDLELRTVSLHRDSVNPTSFPPFSILRKTGVSVLCKVMYNPHPKLIRSAELSYPTGPPPNTIIKT